MDAADEPMPSLDSKLSFVHHPLGLILHRQSPRLHRADRPEAFRVMSPVVRYWRLRPFFEELAGKFCRRLGTTTNTQLAYLIHQPRKF